MHRRELTALSTAARTRVHISLLLVARRASETKDSKPHGSSSRARRSGERYDTCVVGFAAFASTADSIHTTHAERRAARESSFTRTANATTPQVYPLLRRSSSARSPPRPCRHSVGGAERSVSTSARPRSRPHARRGGFEERLPEVLPLRDGVGYAELVAAYKCELDVLWHRLALENRGHLGRQRTATS